MVGASLAILSEHFLRERAKAAAHAVADDGVADFLGNGNAQPNLGAFILPVFHKQNKTGSCISLPPVSGQEIRPFFDDAITAHVAVRLLAY